ncbi:MAG: hypothetical protein BGO69_17170 [Bacteroidetes bacterium 46-16]|nr:MAG: hypothetical protein BGO69_17170 [Bacteroidetes bacterium 46-16]
MNNWFDENKERYDKEIAALEAAKISYQVDENAKKYGVLRLNLTITAESILLDIPDKFLPLELTVVFPDIYPYSRPQVYALNIALARHQNLTGKNLCLLPRQTSYWLPETLLVTLLNEQLWKVLTEGEQTSSDILKDNPEEQAEPVSEYYQTVNTAPILFDTTAYDAIPATGHSASLIGSVDLGYKTRPVWPFHMFALRQFDEHGNRIADAKDNIKGLYDETVRVPIYKLDKYPPSFDAGKDLAWLKSELEKRNERFKEYRQEVKLSKPEGILKEIVGLTFPEEIRPGEIGQGWLFISTLDFLKPVRKKDGGIKKVKEKHLYYSKVNHISRNDLSFRAPSLSPLADKNIAVIGLGALGAPSAIEFARNGIGRLGLLDIDTVDAGTFIRWPLGLKYAGQFKTDALKNFLSENYPNTDIVSDVYRIGAAAIAAEDVITEIQKDKLSPILDKASLIYDATAEIGISHFLFNEAKKRNLPFVSIYATPGVWGGVVLKVVPSQTEGCWMCLRYALEDGSIPDPPANPDGNIQAAGCGDISFVGTSFELQNIALAGVRMAIGILTALEGGYTDLKADVGVLSLVDKDYQSILPQWAEYQLKKHPNCPYCGTKNI